MFYINLFCAITALIYFLIQADGILFNAVGLVWFVVMLANMAQCVKSEKRGLYHVLSLLLPLVLILMKCMLATNTSSSAMSIFLHVLVVLYYVFSAYIYWALEHGTLSKSPAKAPNTASWIFYGLLCLLITVLFVDMFYHTLITPSLSMSKPIIQMLSGFRLFFSMAFYATGIGLAHRFIAADLPKASQISLLVTACLFFASLLPSFAAPGSASNANKAYERFFGEDDFSFAYSIPQALFGGTESGYIVTKNITYTTMNYDGEDYELKFDLYKPEQESGKLPVLLRIHGSGGSKGVRNNALMSEALSSEGFAVIDLNYGNEKVKPGNDQLVENVCVLLNYLYENQKELNLDVQRIYLSGVSRGGKMCLMTAAAWSNNKYFDLKNKVTIAGNVILWGVMDDVFLREGDERILSLEELNQNFPKTLFIDTTNDGSVQGQHLLQGVLYTLGVDSANIELRYAMHGANNDYYGFWGQLVDAYILRFIK